MNKVLIKSRVEYGIPSDLSDSDGHTLTADEGAVVSASASLSYTGLYAIAFISIKRCGWGS